MLEGLAADAGLAPTAAFDTSWACVYPDAEPLGRAMVAPAGIAAIVGQSREEELTAAIVEGLAPYRTEGGAYRIINEYRLLIARA